LAFDNINTNKNSWNLLNIRFSTHK